MSKKMRTTAELLKAAGYTCVTGWRDVGVQFDVYTVGDRVVILDLNNGLGTYTRVSRQEK